MRSLRAVAYLYTDDRAPAANQPPGGIPLVSGRANPYNCRVWRSAATPPSLSRLIRSQKFMTEYVPSVRHCRHRRAHRLLAKSYTPVLSIANCVNKLATNILASFRKTAITKIKAICRWKSASKPTMTTRAQWTTGLLVPAFADAGKQPAD